MAKFQLNTINKSNRISICWWLHDSSHDKLEGVTSGFVKRKGRWSLTVSVPKTKRVAFGDGLSVADIAPLQTNGGEIEMVNNFTHRFSGVWWREICEDNKCRLAKVFFVA